MSHTDPITPESLRDLSELLRGLADRMEAGGTSPGRDEHPALPLEFFRIDTQVNKTDDGVRTGYQQALFFGYGQPKPEWDWDSTPPSSTSAWATGVPG